MTKVVFALSLLVLTTFASAQNSPLPTKTFSFNGNAVSLPGNRGTFVGTDAGVSFHPTDRLGLDQTNILSSDGKLSFYGGGAEYAFPVLSRYFNDHSNISGFRLHLGVRAFTGVDRVKDDLGAVSQHWGGLAQGTFAYSFDSGGTWQFGANIGLARFPGYAKGWTPVVEVGPQFHF